MLKRSAPFSAEEPNAKHHAEPFRGLGREGYLQQRIHRRLQAQAATLDDEGLQFLGEMSFNEQFPALEGMLSNNGDADALFEELGFQGYLQRCVHRKLQSIAARFTAEELLALGKLSFTEQFQSLGLPGPEEEKNNAGPSRLPSVFTRSTVRSLGSGRQEREASRNRLFGDHGREGFLQCRVHRMLQTEANRLSDTELLKFGRMSFNEQFTFMGVAGPKEQSGNTGHDLFGDMGRRGYVQTRIHRRLHDAVQELHDEDVFALGQQSFNEQFRALGQDENVEPNGAPFGKDSRESYIQIHVHRKLHAHVSKMSDEEVFNLGKLGFNEQFRTLSVDATEADEVNFGQSGRSGYIQQHIHRRLHSRAAQLNDKDLLELGKLSFNEQFSVLQVPGPKEEEQQELFGDAGRDGYLKQRIHRMLHTQAASLSNAELFHLGERSFNEQFTALGCPGPKEMEALKTRQPSTMTSAVEAGGIPFLRGLSRQDYMQQRIHRKLHAQGAYLSDTELFRIGELSFNEQFAAMETATAAKGKGTRTANLFGGLDRAIYMQQRVHRKLHSRAVQLTDEDLAQLGSLSFNEQFPCIESMFA